MLAENAVLCQGNYDGFLYYFFYLIISFEINIQSFVNFQPWIKPRNRRALDGVNQNCLKIRKF